MAEFWEYKLEAEMLCLGERIKKGTLRPTVLTVPSTQITGAIRAVTSDDSVWAIGYLEDDYLSQPKIERQVYAPRDQATGVSKIPLMAEVLRDVHARVFVRAPGDKPPFDSLDIVLGAFRSRGLGRATLTYCHHEPDMDVVEGRLRSRLPEDKRGFIGVEEVIKPLYGYLFRPDPDPHNYALGGSYVRALLEDSVVRGYAFIVKGNS